MIKYDKSMRKTDGKISFSRNWLFSRYFARQHLCLYYFPLPSFSPLLLFENIYIKSRRSIYRVKNNPRHILQLGRGTHSNTLNLKEEYAYVQALASQGSEIALYYALYSTKSVNLLIVSPLLRGSNPYPCGSLTYRSIFGCHLQYMAVYLALSTFIAGILR